MSNDMQYCVVFSSHNIARKKQSAVNGSKRQTKRKAGDVTAKTT